MGKLIEQKYESTGKMTPQQLSEFKKVAGALKWSIGGVEKLANCGQDWKPV